MNTATRAGLTLATGAALTFVAAPASAHPDGHHEDPVVEVGEWALVPEDAFAAFSFEACGDTITMAGGDVLAAEERVSVLKSGATLIEFRGDVTVDLTRESDGAVIDELDISGVASTRISADGTEVTETLFGASILFPVADTERPVFLETFGTDLAYFSDPAESVVFRLVVDAATGEVQEVRSIEVDAHIVDLCQKFDRHGDEHHDGDKHYEHHDYDHHDDEHHDYAHADDHGH
jgi:hypothetical protein